MEEGISVMPGYPAGVVPMVPWDLSYKTLEVVLDPKQSNSDYPFFPAFFSPYRNSNESHFACEVSD